jgi:hypothetical protein
LAIARYRSRGIAGADRLRSSRRRSQMQVTAECRRNSDQPGMAPARCPVHRQYKTRFDPASIHETRRSAPHRGTRVRSSSMGGTGIGTATSPKASGSQSSSLSMPRLHMRSECGAFSPELSIKAPVQGREEATHPV